MGETTAHRPLSDLTIQGFIVHSWYKHSHQVCVEVKMGQRCQQITHTLYCHKHHTLKRHSKCIVSVIENMLCTCIINFGPLLQFQVNSFTHGEIMTRFYVTLTMEQYFIMARSHVTLTLKAVKEILWCYGIQMKLLRPNFRTVRFINFLPKMYLNRVNLYPEKKICSQMPWERKLLSLPVLLKITYPDLDLPCKTTSTVFVFFSLLQALGSGERNEPQSRDTRRTKVGGRFGFFVHNPTPPLKMWSLQTGTTSMHYSHYIIFNVPLLHLRCNIFLQYTIR